MYLAEHSNYAPQEHIVEAWHKVYIRIIIICTYEWNHLDSGF